MSNPTNTAPALASEAPRSESAPRTSARAASIANPQRAPAKNKRSPLFWLIILIAGAAAAVWVVQFIHRKIVFEETDDAYLAGHVHQVSSRLDGTVTDVLVEENQTVKAGEVLARLDAQPFEIALQKARAALGEQKAGAAQAHAALNQAQADKAQADAQLVSTDAQVQRIDAQLQMANINLGRNERLFREDARAVSKADVDTTRTTADASNASLAAAKADAAAARAKVSATQASIESAQASISTAAAKIDAAEAAVRDAERELSYVEIKAPADGRIGNKNVERGNRIQVGQPLFALVEPHCWIVANFKETQLRQMHPGQPVEISIDAVDGHAFTGKVDSISPATGAEFALLPPDNATGNFTKVVQRAPVKIVLDPETVRGFEDRLSPGLSTVVSVRIK